MVFAEPEIKGLPNDLIKYLKAPPDTVVISAEATFEVQADRAVAMISVITEDGLLKKSLEQNQNLRKEIIEKFKKSGISSDRISGTKFSSTPQYGVFGKKPSSYKVENVLKIVVGNEEAFQQVASVIDSHEEVFFRELKFEHRDKENHKLKALEKAFDNLFKKKDMYEKRLGIILIPKKFTDEKVPEHDALQGVRVRKSEYLKSSLTSRATSSATPIFGELIYNASLRVEFSVKKSN